MERNTLVKLKCNSNWKRLVSFSSNETCLFSRNENRNKMVIIRYKILVQLTSRCVAF